jgi:AcrR family transcriptional regulator
VSRSVDLPSKDHVREAAQTIVEQARHGGLRPSVLAIARRFGLSNTTFRRHFPDIARELGEHRRTPPPAVDGSAEAAHQESMHESNAKLRRDNRTLLEHLELAVANIMRLTLENQQLRRELEVAAKVTRIDTRTQITGPHTR